MTLIKKNRKSREDRKEQLKKFGRQGKTEKISYTNSGVEGSQKRTIIKYKLKRTCTLFGPNVNVSMTSRTKFFVALNSCSLRLSDPSRTNTMSNGTSQFRFIAEEKTLRTYIL